MCALERTEGERLLRRLLREIADADWAVMPVAIAQRLQRIIREASGNPDPYRRLKDKMNNIALALLPALTETLQQQPDQREAVTRLAIAGNLLDAGSKNRLEPENLEHALQAVWNKPLVGNIDELFSAADQAGHILYLADNAGEIVFDRLLIEALPTHKIVAAVRGAPVINDATMADAQIAGISKIVRVITNGSDAPGTLLDECSAEFRACFNRADLIIAKGQGNYETLADADNRVFFLLTVKCPMIAASIGAPVGALVVKRASNGGK